MRNLSLVLLALVGVLLLAGTGRADLILLKHGGKIRGTILRETDDEIVIAVDGMGKMTVERARVREVLRADGSRHRPRPTARPEPSRLEPTTPRKAAPPLPSGPGREEVVAFREALPASNDLPTDLLRRSLTRLGAVHRSAAPVLSHALKHDHDWRVRLLAVRALKPLGEATAVPALIHALDDPFRASLDHVRDGIVRRAGPVIQEEAIEALLITGEPAQLALLSTARDPKSPEQLEAVRGLQRLSVSGRLPLFLALAQDSSQNTRVRQAAIEGLAGEGGETPVTLVSLLQDRAVREDAERALRGSPDGAAIPLLMGNVSRAAADWELARRSAKIIDAIDSRWRPPSTAETVDLLLFRADLRRIRTELGDRAKSRLDHWCKSKCTPMRLAAGQALSYYRMPSLPRTSPAPTRPTTRRPRVPSG
jgi:hypothetical protein